MRHYPVYLDLRDARIVVSGNGETALAKLRLLMKSEARLDVYGDDPIDELLFLADENKINLIQRIVTAADIKGAALFYGASDEPDENLITAQLARSENVLVNVVDNLEASQFITPAIVDRDPVTIAIGTEGAAPVLARRIKADIEAMLPSRLGLLARIAQTFRPKAEQLPGGRRRRNFWARFYDGAGSRALEKGGKQAVTDTLENLFEEAKTEKRPKGHVSLVGAGPGDPELLTLKARRMLDEADVILYDCSVSGDILELARREAIMVDIGHCGPKQDRGSNIHRDDVHELIIRHAQKGHQIVYLKSDAIRAFDDEVEALDAAAVAWSQIPGVAGIVPIIDTPLAAIQISNRQPANHLGAI
ncbi:MAG: siroheme synthase [Hyphomicrobiales bacterium]|nr:MAG: siroheme synthase [Hyphomicrobiales bacterium]